MRNNFLDRESDDGFIINRVRYIKEEIKFPGAGINKNLVVAKDEQVLEIFKCPICLNLEWDPVECKNDECQNTFCKTCVEKIISQGQNKCPICKTSPFLYKKSINTKKALSMISIKCIFEGCKEIPNYTNYLDHLEKCPFVLYRCNNEGCNFKGIKTVIENHIEECGYRKIRCELCNKIITFNQKEEHIKICEEELIKCPLCEIEMKRKIYNQKHYSRNNENVICLKQQISNLKSKNEKIIENKDKLEKSNKELTNEVQNLKTQIKNNEKIIENKNKSIKDLEQSNNKLQLSNKELENEIENLKIKIIKNVEELNNQNKTQIINNNFNNNYFNNNYNDNIVNDNLPLLSILFKPEDGNQILINTSRDIELFGLIDIFFKRFKNEKPRENYYFIFNGILLKSDDRRKIFDLGFQNGSLVRVFERGV